MKTLGFFGSMHSSFIRNDYTMLSKDFNVIPIEPPQKKTGWLQYPSHVRHVVKESDAVFCWFAGWHSLFPVFFSKIYKKKSFVVVGGYDAAYCPEINYGAFTNIKERAAAKYVLRNASVILPVSEFNKKEVQNKVTPKSIEVVYSAVDTDYYKPNGEKENNLVITVSGIDAKTLKRKGIETFVRTARHLPEYRFVVIGKPTDTTIEYLQSIATSNMEFTGYVTQDELRDWYRKASVICQLSYYEGFPLSLAEGMACGCIPVTTRERSGTAEFVGDLGFYVSYGDETKTADMITKATGASEAYRRQVRRRITDHFTSTIRRMRLRSIINA